MRKSTKFFLYCLILLVSFIPASTAAADIGPKPTMDFSFEYQTDEPLTIVEGVLLQCEDPQCLESAPLEHLGPQNFTCTTESCTSMAYGYAGDNQLVITFSDGVTRQSNLFGKQNFNAHYTVTVYQDDLLVQETGGGNAMGYLFGGVIGIFCLLGLLLLVLLVCLIVLITRGGREEPLLETSRRWIISIWIIGIIIFGASILAAQFLVISLALPLTILIEGILITCYYTYLKQPRLVPLTLNLTGNLLTQLILWYLLSNSSPGGMGWISFLLAEAVIVLIEAAILYWPQRKQINFKHAISISFILNLASVTVGLLISV